MSILKEHIEKNIKANKKVLMITTGVTLSVIIGSTVWLGIRNNAYTVSVEGKVVGITKTKEDAQAAYDEVVNHIEASVETPFVVNETLQVAPIHASGKEISSYQELSTAIADKVTYNVEAYEILVDNTRYGVVHSKEEATKILEEIAQQYAPENGTVTLEVAQTAKEDEALQANEKDKLEQVKEEPLEENDHVLDAKDASTSYQEDVSKVSISNVTKEEIEEVKEDSEVKQEDEEAQKIERNLQRYDFNEEVKIKNCFVPSEEILSVEDAQEVLTGNRYESMTYQLVEGDNLWDVAVAFNTTQKRLLEINPQITDETKLQIGEEINVEKGVPILSITTVEEATFKELIPGEIQYKPSEQFYEGETKVIVEGNDGIKELTVEVTKINGKEVSRRTLAEEVLKKEKVTVIAYGIKKKEEDKPSSDQLTNSEKPEQNNSNSGSNSSGSHHSTSNNKPSSGNTSSSKKYGHPLKGAGRISSTYGPRWGTFHYGLDFAAPAGTPIYASRAGKVIYSAYNQGGYGKLIIIEHNDGTQTYYAHCSSLYVQVGQSVSQGERIAGVGTTGNSTGNHLHFEIRINGRPVDPAPYL